MSFHRLPLRGLPVLALALSAAACTHDAAGDASASLEDSVQPRSRVMALAPDSATRRASVVPEAVHPRMASLPGEAAAPGAIRSRDYADGFRQDITLAGARVPLVTNGITVLARTDTRETLEAHTPLYKPSEGAIRSEIGAAMPHIAMQIVDRERANDYGPYGLALGRTGADIRCMYMWQWIDSNRLPRASGLAGPVSVRVRLCRAGTTFDEMAAWADHLILGPQDGPAVVAGDNRADETRVLPVADSEDTNQPRDIRPKTSRRADRHRLAEHRSRHRLMAVAEREEPREDIAAPAPAAEGPRYLTPSAVAPAAVRAQPVVVTTPAATAPHFSGDLPPEAFAGPKAH